MREYIKCTSRAAEMLFKRGSEADYDRADAIDAYNTGMAERLYSGIMNGNIDYAYTRTGKQLIVYTRSLRGLFIQASYFVEISGCMEATRHSDITTANDLCKAFIPGKYINIKAA